MPANGSVTLEEMRSVDVTLRWGDGDHHFNIARIKHVAELERKCGCGIAEVFERLRSGKWYHHDVRETIRIGLIGGGSDPIQALALVEMYVDGQPWEMSVRVAFAIIAAAMVGVPGDEVGKKARAGRAKRKATPASSSPQSMAKEPPSASPQDRSMNSPSGNLPPASTDSLRPMAGSLR